LGETSCKLLFFVTEDWYFCSHRLSLAVAARNAGFDVCVVTRVRNHGAEIRSCGLRLIPIELSRHGINPFGDIALIRRLARIYREELPDLVHHVAMKPVLYGSLAAWLAGTSQVVNAMAGLGFLFVSSEIQARLLRPIVKVAFRFLFNRRGTRLILQNPDDMRLLSDANILDAKQIRLIRGSGVDTQVFIDRPEPESEPVVILASRMLWDKGIGEFVEAARKLKDSGVRARFVLIGDTDAGNPAAVSKEQLESWHNSGGVEWWGRREDMPEVFAQCNIFCLPTAYGEGVPKVLIEAASCGRAIVTSDWPGCREIVRNGENGLLVPVRDADALANALQKLIDNAELRQEMGVRGREIVKAEFSMERVVEETLAVYRELL
jgi:glycosyltransferase involved in cell wall biosynthesis